LAASLVCNWEGNVRYTPDLEQREALKSSASPPSAHLACVEDRELPAAATESTSDATVRLESDTLPIPPSVAQDEKA
jgi:hypothetical protein